MAQVNNFSFECDCGRTVLLGQSCPCVSSSSYKRQISDWEYFYNLGYEDKMKGREADYIKTHLIFQDKEYCEAVWNAGWQSRAEEEQKRADDYAAFRARDAKKVAQKRETLPDCDWADYFVIGVLSIIALAIICVHKIAAGDPKNKNPEILIFWDSINIMLSACMIFIAPVSIILLLTPTPDNATPFLVADGLVVISLILRATCVKNTRDAFFNKLKSFI